MTRSEHDEEARERLDLNVLSEIDDSAGYRSEWVDSLRRLNTADMMSPINRQITAAKPGKDEWGMLLGRHARG